MKKNKIAFISERDGNPEVYVMDENGSNPVRITNNRAKEGRPSWSPDGKFLVFSSDRNGFMNEDIFSVRYTPAGGEVDLEQLTDYKGIDKDPVYSPSGDKIAFISNQDSGTNEELMIMNANGASKIRLTTQDTWTQTVKVPWTCEENEPKSFDIDSWVYNSWPTWSPNGKRIAFETFGIENTHKIYFINPDDPRSDSRAVKYLKLESCDPKGNPSGNQTWSTDPNGHWLLGVVDENKKILNPVDGNTPLPVRGRVKFELYAANSGWFKENQHFKLTLTYIDGTSGEAITKITKEKSQDTGLGGISLIWKGIDKDIVGPGDKAEPDERPDGHFSLKLEIGAVRMEYTPEGFSDMQPSWSPLGNKIAFVSTRAGNEEIYVSYIDGSSPVRLTKHTARDYAPSWSPDGTKIIFTSNRDGLYNEQIYIMNADGSNQVNLSKSQYKDSYSVWSPVVSKK